MKKKRIIKNENGSALIPVLCILFILAAFVLTMIFAAHQVLTMAQRSATKEQCRLTAITLSEQIGSQLEAEDGSDSTKLNGFQQYLYDKIFADDEWKYYNEEEEAHSDKEKAVRSFELNMTEDGSTFVGDSTMKIYWESNQEDQDALRYENIVLVVKITSSLRGQKYTVTTQYELKKPGTETVDWSSTENWKWAHSWNGN